MPPQDAGIRLCAAKGLCPADGVQLVAFLLQALPAKAGILQESKTGPRQGSLNILSTKEELRRPASCKVFPLAARHSASSLSQVYPLFPTSGMGFCGIYQNFAQLIDGMHKFFIMKLLLYSVKATSLILLHCRTKFCGDVLHRRFCGTSSPFFQNKRLSESLHSAFLFLHIQLYPLR